MVRGQLKLSITEENNVKLAEAHDIFPYAYRKLSEIVESDELGLSKGYSDRRFL